MEFLKELKDQIWARGLARDLAAGDTERPAHFCWESCAYLPGPCTRLPGPTSGPLEVLVVTLAFSLHLKLPRTRWSNSREGTSTSATGL